MTASSFGPKKQPRFAAGDAPDLSGNPTEVAEYAAKFGNYTEGTTAERNTFTASAWPGLVWHDTTLKRNFIFTDNAWQADPRTIVSGAGYDGSGNVIIKTLNAVMDSNGQGKIIAPWPGGAFPNGLLGFVPTIGDGDAFIGWASNVGSSATEMKVILRTPAGPQQTRVRLGGLAIGW